MVDIQFKLLILRKFSEVSLGDFPHHINMRLVHESSLFKQKFV